MSFEEYDLETMRADALRVMRSFDGRIEPDGWRHHGAGMLQCYLADVVRVHVWDPRLRVPGIDAGGGMHNHRYTLASTVLAGSLPHRRISVVRGADTRTHDVWAVRAAPSKQEAGLRRLPVAVAAIFHPAERYAASSRYVVPVGHFHHIHQADGEGPAVTYVECVGKGYDQRPQILSPIGTRPQHAYGHDVPAGLLQTVMLEAIAELEHEIERSAAT